MRKIFVLLAAFLLAVSGSAFADPTGKWVLHMEGPMGPEEWKLELKTDDSVAGKHPIFGSFEGTHKCTAEKWDVYVILKNPMGEMEMNFLGTIKGRSASGKVNLMSMETTWNAKKK